MFCTGKEQLTCNSEKMGCEGCYYFNDENKIEVGEYVRTKTGEIYKVDDLEDYDFMRDKFYNMIVKHSSNIIDLVEVRRLCEWI